MNWTEGNLNRHSRARKGKETLLRQKEHFAKARAGLPDANFKISPPSVSVLAVSARPPSVCCGALKSTSSRSHQNVGQLTSSRYFSEAHVELPAPTRTSLDHTEEAMHHKRRKLLLKGDWVGINVQKPIEMEFKKPGASPSNPWAAKKPRHPASKHKLRKLVGLVHFGGDNRSHQKAVETSTPSLRQVKVRIGPIERGHHQNRGRVSASLAISSHQSQNSVSQKPLLTTSPLLFHPVPTRPTPLPLLETAESTLAQVGAEHPAIPTSETAENDMWRNLVAGTDEVSASNETETSGAMEDAAQGPISPGVSQLYKSFPEDDQAAPSVAGSTEELSLLAISSSPKLSPSPGVVDEVASLEMNLPGYIASVRNEPPSVRDHDGNDMWKKFVFGESSENLEKELEEASREGARCLGAPLPSTSTFLTPASHVATAGTSSAEDGSGTTSASMDTAVRTDLATHGSSSSWSANGTDIGLELSLNDLAAPASCEADSDPSSNNPQRLKKHVEVDDGFKFARPKLFIGKKLGQVDEKRQLALSAPQVRGTGQTRRRQGRATDGRANIRKLPNYGSDPIEEFEGDVCSDRAEKGSMFGPLETENGD
jgi:hypothetical protein